MPGFTKEESLEMLLGQVCRLHHCRAHMLLAEIGLYRGQPPFLHILWQKDGRTHKELAEALHLQPATVSKIVQRMENAGWLITRADPDDLRVSRVYLTEKGRKIQGKVTDILRELEQEAFAHFTLEERVLLRRLLLQVRDNLLRVCDGKPTT